MREDKTRQGKQDKRREEDKTRQDKTRKDKTRGETIFKGDNAEVAAHPLKPEAFHVKIADYK